MYMLFFVYMYYVHISAVPLSLSPAFFTLYYVCVQASRTRVSEAYTELEPTFANEKLETSVVWTTILMYPVGSSNRCLLPADVNT